MARAILVRHGRTTANVSGVLAGRGDAELDDHGTSQASLLAEHLRPVTLDLALVSPMLRTRQTAHLVLDGRDVQVVEESGVAEVDYGEWTGGSLKTLGKEPLWALVQSHPSSVTFPAGESMAAMASRAVTTVRAACDRADALQAEATAGEEDQAEEGSAPPPPNVLVVTHGDIIKAILADALGMHLDAFQRICVDPGSVSVVRYQSGRPFVECTNTDGSQLARALGVEVTTEAVLGGGTGR